GRSDLLVDQRGSARGRAAEVGYCRKNFVLNVDQIARVFRDITGVSDHDGNRLADVSCPIDGDGIVGERSLHHAWQRPDQVRDVLAGDDASNAPQLPRSPAIDPPPPAI